MNWKASKDAKKSIKKKNEKQKDESTTYLSKQTDS